MKYLLSLFLTLFVFLATATHAHAVCPVCTVAVGAGLGISRWIGIDDSVAGVWIGGLILSSGLWLSDWIGKKGWRLPYKEIISVVLFLLFVIPPLYWGKIIGLPGNTLFGIDKIILGIIFGSILFTGGVWLDKWLRTTNEGKVYIYYQKVIAPVFLLTLGSFFLYLITS